MDIHVDGIKTCFEHYTEIQWDKTGCFINILSR